MLDAIKDAVNDIVDFISLIFDFIKGLIEDIVNLTTTVSDTVAKIPKFFEWMPDYLIVGVIALFSVVVIYKILGREG